MDPIMALIKSMMGGAGAGAGAAGAGEGSAMMSALSSLLGAKKQQELTGEQPKELMFNPQQSTKPWSQH